MRKLLIASLLVSGCAFTPPQEKLKVGQEDSEGRIFVSNGQEFEVSFHPGAVVDPNNFCQTDGSDQVLFIRLQASSIAEVKSFITAWNKEEIRGDENFHNMLIKPLSITSKHQKWKAE